ncbi:HAD domain-containing protein [Massilia aquatica]|uniref:Uncharacterized protein n=1 Tax=Massilia aquatica TaxID=2609000 RepID=A0ABX0MBM9_9BURK|nr:HAD domain-containing protein [Massilia aquatica]NHZ44585.1 hypothetical protein [Massilia aquatica]
MEDLHIIDGVTHDDAVYSSRQGGIHIRTPGRTLFEWLPIMEEMLAPYPDVKIVLSTSWVRFKGFEFAKSRLTTNLQSRVIGATFDNRVTQKYDFDGMSRGQQICADVERRMPERWFAIDNDENDWPAWCRDLLIKTDDRLGLSEPAVQDQIRKMLATFNVRLGG